jgi:hypothetical protein
MSYHFLDFFYVFVSIYSVIRQSYLEKLATVIFIVLCFCLFYLWLGLERLLLTDLKTGLLCVVTDWIVPLSSELKN